MTDQPHTWDGEPLYSKQTVSEAREKGLFAAEAFEQLPGQIPFDQESSEANLDRLEQKAGGGRELRLLVHVNGLMLDEEALAIAKAEPGGYEQVVRQVAMRVLARIVTENRLDDVVLAEPL